MYGQLYKYLALHRRLTLPGIGQFLIEDIPARIDFVNRKLYPFTPVIRFTQGTAMADKKFYNFIARGMQLDDLEAIQRFNEFIFEIKELFTLNGFVDFPGIGRLTRQFSNTYSFKPLNNIQPYYPEIHAERVVRKNAGHTVKQGEEELHSSELTEDAAAEQENNQKSWKMYALALALIAAMAIAYYYLTKGGN
ncbi:MAG TPA: hypothetical protein VHB48_03050 [Chitinophagaceae bacterium]|jgi:hypothetical protein|nr:hypothetical protein [Chitinophagaceae bacterium]